MTRGEMYARIGLLDEVDPMTSEAFYFAEQLEMKKSDQGHDAEDPWHISFHGSQFPGDNPFACGRQNIYRLMDVPRGGFTRQARQFMQQGKDMERQLVNAWWRAGYLVSAPPFPGVRQTMFEDSDHMLTSTVDAIVRKLRSSKPYVCEVKQIYDDHVDQMRRLIRDPHENYVRQVKCQIGLAHEAGPQIVQECYNTGRLAIQFPKKWKDGRVIELSPPVCAAHSHSECLIEVEIEPPDYGYLYYVSRDNPTVVRSYFFEYDPAFMEAGRKQLARWRDEWLEGNLPQTRFEEKKFSHPFGWQWTKEEYPCKWCDFGQSCREDHRKAVNLGHKLPVAESTAIEDALRVRPDYDFERVRAAQLSRWGLKDGREAADAKAA